MSRSRPVRSLELVLTPVRVLVGCVVVATLAWAAVRLASRNEYLQRPSIPGSAQVYGGDRAAPFTSIGDLGPAAERTSVDPESVPDQPVASESVFGDVTGQGLLSESEFAFAREILGGWREQSEFLAASVTATDGRVRDPLDELEEARLRYQAEAGRVLVDSVDRGFYFLEAVGGDQRLQAIWLTTAFVLRIGVRDDIDLVVGVPHSEYESVQGAWDHYQAILRVRVNEIADDFNRLPFEERARILSDPKQATRYGQRGLGIHWPTRTLRVADV